MWEWHETHSDDVEKVVVAQRVQDRGNSLAGDGQPQALHAAAHNPICHKTLHTTHSTQHTIPQPTTPHPTLHNLLRLLYNPLCTKHSTQPTQPSTQHTLHNPICHNTLHHNTLYTTHSTQPTNPQHTTPQHTQCP